MRFKVLSFTYFVILTYIYFVNSSLKDDEKQLDIYNNNLQGKSIVSDFCTIEPVLWANICTLAVNSISEECEDYEKMYLHYPAFNTNEPNSDKCQDTEIFVPVINERVNLKHLICHGRPIIIRTDEPNEKFNDNISVYIAHTKNVIILEKVEEGKHKLLKSIFINILRITQNHGILMIPSPKSTFFKRAIKTKMGHAERFSNYQETGNHILRNISKYSFVKVCYMIFSRSEYENKVKLLPKKEIRHMWQSHPCKTNCFLYFFSNRIKFNITMYTCPIFEKMYKNFKLIAGPDANSVIVVKFGNNRSKGRPHELIENISLEFLNFQVRI